MKNNNKGFSLVELIVVIAIMAILAAVAVIGVSVYIPKAQQAADKQLVSDLQYVLDLHAQSTPEDVTAGYIILTPDGAEASGDFVTAVLVATYGEGWDDELKLAYAEWTDDGMLKVLKEYDAADLELITGSSFMNSSTEGMLQAVTGMTDLISNVIQDRGQDTDGEAATHLLNIFGAESDIYKQYVALGELTPEEEATAISNMLVGTMADSIETNPAMKTIIQMYAAAYNYSQMPGGDDAALKKMNENLKVFDIGALEPDEGKTDEQNAGKGWDVIMNGISREEGETDNPFEGFMTYYESIVEEDGQFERDNQALGEMMGAVTVIAGKYQDKESLTDANLFASDEVAGQVDNYLNSVKALAGIDDITALQSLEAGSVVILVTAEGNVSVVPAMN